ncbi:MAG: asparagine synthase (glutamine-hydrolyzing) [Bernardetiaceae bacterium]
MCGITGVYAFNEIGRFDMIKNKAATDALTHRGPDVGRFFNDQYVALGHRRLSILDLSAAADQPMSDPSKRYWLIFNGEIYNHKDLRAQLHGVSFQTKSDTETLLHWLIQKGEDGLDALNGFFAFCFYDAQEDELLLARDRLGIKPLVYFQDENKLVFASELQSLRTYNIPQNLNYAALQLYFRLHYVPYPLTILHGVKKLPPGHLLRIRSNQVSTRSFYEVPAFRAQYSTYAAAQAELRQRMQASVRMRLMADVPLGAFLSGGIDSSLIVALAAQDHSDLHTFSIGYQDEPLFDETRYAQLVARHLGTRHTTFSLTNRDLFDAVQSLLDFLGEPFADSSAIPTFILSQRTRQSVKVALSGDGGDELFAGYQKHYAEWRIRQGGFLPQLLSQNRGLLSRLPQSRNGFFSNKFRQLNRFAEAVQRSPQERYWFLSSFLSDPALTQLFCPEARAQMNTETIEAVVQSYTEGITGADINDILRQDVRYLLPNDMLHKVDQMSMAHGLEVRVPFLDHHVVDFAFGLPERFKIKGTHKKRIVQDAFRELLPRALYHRPKQGFDVPLKKGFQGELRPMLEALLDSRLLQEQNLFSMTYIESLKKRIFAGQDYEQNHVWALLVFQHWWKKVYA